jgi:hypothetical protein
MEEWGYEPDLKLDLFATQRGRGGPGRNLRKRDLRARLYLSELHGSG